MKTMNKKKILIIVVGILLSIGIIIGVSYAWWSHVVSQEGINTIQSTCLEITLTDENPISLTNAYPITDEEARLLTPYTFTITNTCNTAVEYDVNLDIMESASRLSSEYIAVEFNGSEKKLLNTLESVETSYSESEYIPVEARYLTSGELSSNERKTYTIKLWMDESVTVEDDAMNKSFISKIVVTAKQSHKVRLADIVNLGDYVEMTPTRTSYTIPSSMTGYSQDQTINPSELNLWRVIKKNEDGTVEMISEYVSSKEIYFYGMTGYKILVNGLQEIAKQYETEGYTVNSRCFGYYNQSLIVPEPTSAVCGQNVNEEKETLGCGDYQYKIDKELVEDTLGSLIANNVETKVSSNYWAASRFYEAGSNFIRGQGIYVRTDGIMHAYLNYGLWEGYCAFGSCPNNSGKGNFANGNYYRPIIILKNNLIYESGEGTLENPYRLSIYE